MKTETIAAVATAPGEAGIGIIRISGDEAINIADKIFKGRKEKVLSDFEERRLTYGHIVDPSTNKKLDEVLAVYMKGPKTYTTEDVVEINCHGGIVPVRKVLDLILLNGARMADKGEFTKRAFLNGRLDLSQAEAIMDMISAKTESSFDASLGQMEGRLSKEIHSIRYEVVSMAAQIEVNIDFPEDDIEELTADNIKEDAKKIEERLTKLIDSFEAGRIIKDGLKTVILGKPNVGKSSLMNAVLREQRAIVTDIAGTTRDVIEEFVNIKGIPLRIVDTAGIRDTEDIVEKIGVDKAKELVDSADLIIAVFDRSKELSKEDEDIIELIKGRKSVVLLNKTDLPEVLKKEEILKHLPNETIMNISALEGSGLEDLEKKLEDMFFKGEVSIKDDLIITNRRHKEILIHARKNIQDALNSIEYSMPLDCVEVDIKACWDKLGEINGDTVKEDIVDTIFRDFCVGK